MSRPVDFETVREIALTLPGVVASMGKRGISFKVRGKLLSCKAIHPSAEEGTLMIRIGSAQRAKLLATHPDIYYLTPHYEPYPSLLVRLSRISRAALAERLEEAWRFVTSDVRPAGRASPKGPRG
jgi:hypothetical protein